MRVEREDFATQEGKKATKSSDQFFSSIEILVAQQGSGFR